MTTPLTIGAKNLLSTEQTHHLAILWIIERVDVTGGHDGLGRYYYTDHNSAIIWDTGFIGAGDFHTFLPSGAFIASAREEIAGMAPVNFEATGIIDPDEITFEDLRTGRFDNAFVDQIIINWRFPWVAPVQWLRYTIADLQHTENTWHATLEGPSHIIKKNMGESYTRLCRYRLGDQRCTVLLPPFTQNASVQLAVTDPVENRYKFLPLFSDFPDIDNFFRFGSITWTSGANTGFVSEVAEDNVGPGAQFLTLRLMTPFPIVTGDEFIIIAGCDKTITTCFEKFNNVINHGGFPTIPGTDRMIETPDARI